MKRIPSILAVAGLLMATGCGGNSATPPAPAPKANAQSTITFKIPLGSSDKLMVPTSATSRRPMFIDGNSNGTISAYFDGQTVIPAVNFAPNGPVAAGPGPSGTVQLAQGGNFSYTSQIVFVTDAGNPADPGNQPYVQVTGNFTATVGNHTIGVVQTNGACNAPSVDQGPCIPGNNGYVLAEGQKTLTLQPGSNNSVALYMRGVMASAYVCDTGCSGTSGVNPSTGAYDLYVVTATESGDAIPYQKDDQGNVVPFDNGSYKIIENDSNNVLTIDAPGPYAQPGTYRHGLYGEAIHVTCNKVGTGVVSVQLLNGAPTVPVTGYTYTPSNYPAANSVIGSVGANQYYGDQLTLNCTATGSISIQ